MLEVHFTGAWAFSVGHPVGAGVIHTSKCKARKGWVDGRWWSCLMEKQSLCAESRAHESKGSTGMVTRQALCEVHLGVLSLFSRLRPFCPLPCPWPWPLCTALGSAALLHGQPWACNFCRVGPLVTLRLTFLAQEVLAWPNLCPWFPMAHWLLPFSPQRPVSGMAVRGSNRSVSVFEVGSHASACGMSVMFWTKGLPQVFFFFKQQLYWDNS